MSRRRISHTRRSPVRRSGYGHSSGRSTWWVWIVIIAAVIVYYRQQGGTGHGSRPAPRSTVCTETYKGGC